MHMILLTYRVCASTPKGFEPLRAEPNGFLVHLLNHSDTVSSAASLQSAPELSPMLHIIHACFVLAHHSQSTPSLLSLSQPFSLRLRCASSSSSKGYGATAARLTPDQKVGSLNLSGLILFSPELVLSGLPQPELWLPCQLPSLAPPWPEGQGVLLLVQRVWGSSPTGGVCPSGLPSLFFSYILPVQGRCSPCPCL